MRASKIKALLDKRFSYIDEAEFAVKWALKRYNVSLGWKSDKCGLFQLYIKTGK